MCAAGPQAGRTKRYSVGNVASMLCPVSCMRWLRLAASLHASVDFHSPPLIPAFFFFNQIPSIVSSGTVQWWYDDGGGGASESGAKSVTTDWWSWDTKSEPQMHAPRTHASRGRL